MLTKVLWCRNWVIQSLSINKICLNLCPELMPCCLSVSSLLSIKYFLIVVFTVSLRILVIVEVMLMRDIVPTSTLVDRCTICILPILRNFYGMQRFLKQVCWGRGKLQVGFFQYPRMSSIRTNRFIWIKFFELLFYIQRFDSHNMYMLLNIVL